MRYADARQYSQQKKLYNDRILTIYKLDQNGRISQLILSTNAYFLAGVGVDGFCRQNVRKALRVLR